jgi:hypothetical protein
MPKRVDAKTGSRDRNNARSATLRMDMDRQRINLIDTDIETGMTFLRIARTELDLGNLERTTALIAKARYAHGAMAKLLTDVSDADQQQRLREKHQALDAAIREAERLKRRHEEQIG